MAFGSPKGRRHRAKGWRRRKYGFSGLGSRKGVPAAGFGIRVEITRDVGARSVVEFRATACVSKRGRARRRGYYERRCGFGAGHSPTAAAKKALRSMASNLK